MVGHIFFPFLSHLARIRARSARTGTGTRPLRRRLVLPFKPTPRIAVVDAPHILSTRRIRHFNRQQTAQLAACRPGVIAAPVDALLALAECPNLTVTHAVVALTRIGAPKLDEAGRMRLWAAFQVPVFEQLEWLDGALVAEECEAHSSLHVCTTTVRMETSDSGRGHLLDRERRHTG